ncbi:MAG: thiamine diphosphokinase [Clostridia bacterium]|nr:thiamine diphosphokinase [Clostridia bacterium]
MKGRCVIISAGDIEKGDIPQKAEGDLFIAADGGKRYLEDLGVTPDLFIGDLDSAESAPCGVETVLLERRKDDTDTLAAIKAGLERGHRDFLLAGALGGKRFSHSLANIQSLEFLKDRGADGRIVFGNTEARCLDAGEKAVFHNKSGYLSLFSLTETSRVDLRGTAYDGESIVLERGYPLGVSNGFDAEETLVEVLEGRIILIAEYA